MVLECTSFFALHLDGFIIEAKGIIFGIGGVFYELFNTICTLIGFCSLMPPIWVENSPLILFVLAEEENSKEDGWIPPFSYLLNQSYFS